MSVEMERWLGMQNPSVISSLAAVEYDEPTPVYHISDNPSIRMFSPRIPHYRGGDEDATIPRVCVSVSLADTILGTSYYYTDEIDKLRGMTFTLYRFDVKEAIRPTKKILQYPRAIGELWIVPHLLTNYELTPEVVGKITVVGLSDRAAGVEVSYAIDCKEPIPLGINSIVLEKGKHSLLGVSIADIVDGKINDDTLQLSRMSEKEYDSITGKF